MKTYLPRYSYLTHKLTTISLTEADSDLSEEVQEEECATIAPLTLRLPSHQEAGT